MRIRRHRAAAVQIPTASMADIAFLLIIFFMVSTKYQVDKQQLSLPFTRLRTEILAESAFISVTRPGASTDIGVNGSVVRFSAGRLISQPVVDLDDLEQRIAAVVSDQPARFFVIKADQEVPYETFDLILGALKDASAQNVTFLSRKKGP
jgi:biopolymer transport protein ExbD